MKSLKRFKPQPSHDNRRSKLWVKGVNQSNSPWEEKALAVFQPDILVTVQYLSTYRRRFHLQPEQLLMLAVLEDAIICFQDNLTATTPRKHSLFREAEEWIVDDTKSTCSPLTISATDLLSIRTMCAAGCSGGRKWFLESWLGSKRASS